MILNIYAIKDEKVPCYTQLRTAPSDGVAIRNMKVLIDAEQSGDFGKFSDDFKLYKLGSYDTETGDLKPDFQYVMDFNTIKELA